MNSTETLLQEIRDQLVQYARNDPGAKGTISNKAKRLNTLLDRLAKEKPKTQEQSDALYGARERIVLGYQKLIKHSFDAATIYDVDGNQLSEAAQLLKTYYERP